MSTDAPNNESIVTCGYVTIAGRPNVGKSTLLNRVLGQKISIVTRKPQTTRDRILAVWNTEAAQVVFLDTPGIHRPVRDLGRYMNETAHNAILEADLCLWLIDAAERERPGLDNAERRIADRLRESGVPVLVALNKADRVSPKEKLLPLLSDVNQLALCEDVIPISAQSGDGVDTLMDHTLRRLPRGVRLFPTDIISDRPDRFFVAELVRETITEITREEVPYRTAVVIDRFVEQPAGAEIHASIHVETRGQKAIIIGRGGESIARIRETAQAQAKELMQCPVLLHLHVNISPDWSMSPAGLRKMGYE